jgi:multiple sugar transport system ATP-binding protein
MNLVEGEIADGVFTAPNLRIDGLPGGPRGRVTLGFRAEDAQVAPEGGEIAAPVYSIELLGDETMVSVRCGAALVAVKAAKSFRAAIGDAVSIHVPPRICHLFDAATGLRLDA